MSSPRVDKASDPGSYVKAVLNILDDFNEERARLTDAQRATENILDDSREEKLKFDASQKAVLNILDDFNEEKARLAEVQKATLNIFEDFDIEKNKADKAQELQRVLAENLKRSNKELEQFAYVASHDLQEPLRMVASYTELLARRYKGKLDDKGDEFIAFIVDGATHMQDLIKDLLAYSRIGKEQVFQLIDCSIPLNTAVSNLKTAIEESKATITQGPMPKLMVNVQQLTQLFQNLIANAIKYRGESTPQIQIEASHTGHEWTFSVLDNGIGLDMEYANRIFILFQRLQTRAEYSGTGIGLAVCKKIVEQQGGRIWVESEPGKGSKFFFTVPEIQKMGGVTNYEQ